MRADAGKMRARADRAQERDLVFPRPFVGGEELSRRFQYFCILQKVQDRLGISEVALGDVEALGDRHLLVELGILRCESEEVLRVDGADGGLEGVRAGHQRVAEQHVEERRRVGGAAGLDDHALEGRDLAARAAAVQVGERLVQRAGVRAAQAPGVEQHDVVGGLRDHRLVEADLAQLVHHHRGVGERGLLQRRG